MDEYKLPWTVVPFTCSGGASIKDRDGMTVAMFCNIKDAIFVLQMIATTIELKKQFVHDPVQRTV